VPCTPNIKKILRVPVLNLGSSFSNFPVRKISFKGRVAHTLFKIHIGFGFTILNFFDENWPHLTFWESLKKLLTIVDDSVGLICRPINMEYFTSALQKQNNLYLFFYLLHRGY
jgi:hypothetical protein